MTQSALSKSRWSYLCTLGLLLLTACVGAQTAIPTPTPTSDEITFHPSDPEQVTLEAGQPHFVEFFAFW